MSPQANAALEMTLSPEVATVIKAAFFALGHSRRGRDIFYNEDLEIAQVRYKHALLRLKREYPGELCDWTSIRLSACMSGHSCGRRPVTRFLPPRPLHTCSALICSARPQHLCHAPHRTS